MNWNAHLISVTYWMLLMLEVILSVMTKFSDLLPRMFLPIFQEK